MQRIRHAGADPPNALVNQSENDFPPIAGAAVKAAAQVPATMVILSSHRWRDAEDFRYASMSQRLC
jgi:hypothetical protein